MSRTAIVIAAALTFVATVASAPAQAERDRVFVASYGNDSNPCTFGSPCKTFQRAHDTVAAGGEVTAIDSAGFGPLIITKAVTITSPNGIEAGIATPSGDTAITINAGAADTINLNGLTLDGVGGASTGIAFNIGGSLNVQNSVIRNFSGDGIDYVPSASSQLFVANTLISDNGGDGIDIVTSGSGTTNGILDHAVMKKNTGSGLYVDTLTQTINITVSDSVSAGNGASGVFAFHEAGPATPINVMVRNSIMTNNADRGVRALGASAVVLITRSTISGNSVGWNVQSNGVVSTLGDNDIFGNGSVNNAPPSSTSHE
jgi:hypothetical protein